MCQGIERITKEERMVTLDVVICGGGAKGLMNAGSVRVRMAWPGPMYGSTNGGLSSPLQESLRYGTS